MSDFDWVDFLERNKIEHTTKGKNVSSGNVAIKCPWCGLADPSEHMVISLQGKGWICQRNRAHRGLSSARLIQMLLHCSYEMALSMVKGGSFLPDDWHARIMQSLAPERLPKQDERAPIDLPNAFRAIGRSVSSRPYVRYLFNRNYTSRQIKDLYDRWGIMYAPRSSYRGRIIFPVYFEGRLATWTGRTISDNPDTLRYKTLSADPEKAKWEEMPVALGPINNYLLWWDFLLECDAKTIILCEGPFDALKLVTLGWGRGVVATCFFTSQPSPTQIELLHELLPRFKRKLLLLDENTDSAQMTISAELTTLGLERIRLPAGMKDPGVLTEKGLATIV